MRQSAAKFKDHFLFGSIIHIHTPENCFSLYKFSSSRWGKYHKNIHGFYFINPYWYHKLLEFNNFWLFPSQKIEQIYQNMLSKRQTKCLWKICAWLNVHLIQKNICIDYKLFTCNETEKKTKISKKSLYNFKNRRV